MFAFYDMNLYCTHGDVCSGLTFSHCCSSSVAWWTTAKGITRPSDCQILLFCLFQAFSVYWMEFGFKVKTEYDTVLIIM